MFGGTFTHMEYLASIKHVLSSIFFSLAVVSGGSYTQPVTINNPVVDRVVETRVVQEPTFGATISAAADFSTSLSAGISSSATTMTLTSLTIGSETLTSGGLYGFKLGGREYVLGYVSTTTTNQIVYMTRGISRKTGTTTVAAYQSAWGRNTPVEITDAPLLLDLTNKANGAVGYEQPLQYASSVATTTIDNDNRNLVNYELLAYTAFNGAGVIDASQTAKGVVELATQLETASSSSNGSVGVLSIPASNATSTYNSATAALRVVVTQNNGKIDGNFIATSTLTGIVPTGSITAYASTTAPDGWLLADGSSLLRATYPNLFAVIGVSYGSADGTHFTLPDLRGRNILMASTTANIKQTGGESNHTLTTAELAAHTHGIPSGGGASPTSFTSTSNQASAFVQSASAGGDQAHNVLDPYIVLEYIIKY
jgi:microcystin-dependent protein